MFSILPTSYSDLLEKLRHREPFTFSRWGDGEWNCLLQVRPGVNCDQHRYFPELGQQLRHVLRTIPKHPSYLLGIQNLAIRIFGKEIQEWLAKERLALQWHNADIFHKESVKQNLRPLCERLSELPVIVVGPPHLRKLTAFPCEAFIEVPKTNAYVQFDQIEIKVRRALDAQTQFCVLAVSMGMSAELLLHNLQRRYAARCALIDFGSLWDPYVGVVSRKYMHNMVPKL